MSHEFLDGFTVLQHSDSQQLLHSFLPRFIYCKLFTQAVSVVFTNCTSNQVQTEESLRSPTFQIGVVYSVPHKINLSRQESVHQQDLFIIARVIFIFFFGGNV